jgi:hypothetical protein
MTPFLTMTSKICDGLKLVIRQAREISVYRNTLANGDHGFTMQGPSTSLYIFHLAMFHGGPRVQPAITELDYMLSKDYSFVVDPRFTISPPYS